MKICPKCDHPNPDDLSVCEECGANIFEVANDAIDPFIGTLLVGKFRITELIGQGAMGRVYKAIQEPIKRVVAIKILHQHLVEDQRIAKRFQREAEAASRFTHPNSIGIFDFGQTDNNSLYIAMEYITGEDLAEVIAREGHLPPKRIVRIATQALSAIQLAHANSIIHRDLKPENIMLTNLPGQKDFVKVCDFGIAKIQQPPGTAESALTMLGMICGTPYYMSPEQAKGEKLDPRTDLYSMGVIIYEMLTGTVPFTGSTPVEVIAKHLTDTPVPPSKLRPEFNIPRPIEEVVLKAMSKKRELRYSSAQEFSEALENALKEAEFQADLERVLQEAEQSGPIPVAIPASSQQNGPIPVATPAGSQQSGPIPVATPKSHSPVEVAAKPLSLDKPSFPTSDPSLAPSEKNKAPAPNLSANKQPIKSIPLDKKQSALNKAKITPPKRPAEIEKKISNRQAINLDELPEPDYGNSNKSRIIFLILLVLGSLLGGYALYRSSQSHKKKTIAPQPRPITRKIVRKTRRSIKKKKSLTRIIKKRTRRRSTPPPIRPRRPHIAPKKLTTKAPSQLPTAVKINSKESLLYQKKYQRLRQWMRKKRIWANDFSYRNRRLYFSAKKYAKKYQFKKALKNLDKLIAKLKNLDKLPRNIAKRKFERLKKAHRRALRRKRIPKNKLQRIENQIFPKVFRAFMTGQIEEMNRYMNQAFRLLR